MDPAYEELKNLITCQVCFHNFEGRDPRSLPCLHAFCLECLTQIYDAALKKNPDHKAEVSCPSCRGVAQMPEKSINNFPRYFQASQMNDVMKRFKERQQHTDKEHLMCTLCSKAPVAICCFTCAEAVCTECQAKHERNPRFKDHVIVEVTPENMQNLVCQDHDLIVEAFCTQCLQPVCKKCQVLSHIDHSLKEFTLASNEKFQVQQTTILQSSKEAFDHEMKSAHDDIDLHKNKIIHQIEAEAKALHDLLTKHQMDATVVFQSLMAHEDKDQDILTKREDDKINLASGGIADIPNLRISDLLTFGDMHIKLPTSLQYGLEIKENCKYLGKLEGRMKEVQMNDQEVKDSISDTDHTTTVSVPSPVIDQEANDIISADDETIIPLQFTASDAHGNSQPSENCKDDLMQTQSMIDPNYDNETNEDVDSDLPSNWMTTDSVTTANGAESLTILQHVPEEHVVDKVVETVSVPQLVVQGALKLEQDKKTMREMVMSSDTTKVVMRKYEPAPVYEEIDDTFLGELGKDKKEMVQMAQSPDTSKVMNRRRSTGAVYEDYTLPVPKMERQLPQRSKTFNRYKEIKDKPTNRKYNTIPQHVRFECIADVSCPGAITGVCFLPNADILVITSTNGVTLYDGMGREKPFLITPGISDPQGIAIHTPTSTVAIASHAGLHVFYADASGIWSPKLHDIGAVISVAFMPCKDIIVGTHGSKRMKRYRLYTTDEMCIWEKSVAHDCLHLIVTNDNLIFVSAAPDICVYDENGNKLSSVNYGTPYGICTIFGVLVLVADNKDSVLLLNRSGEVLKGIHVMDAPQQVASFADQQFVVCTADGRILIYEDQLM